MLLLTIGIPASGKTTWAKRYCLENPHIIRLSSDELRSIVGESEDDQTVSREAFNILEVIVEHLLAQNYTVLVDSCAYKSSRRKNFINIARKLKKEIKCYYFDIPLGEAKIRNRLRPRKVPEVVIEKFYRELTAPTKEECHSLYVIDLKGETHVVW